ncbi:MAG TPA: PD-(D/E)XK nuclease family protein [Opitutaceae bacterium]|nr:PD-(D/E)XK nuclease family protein [Opitutaceae bacterium]
MVPSPLTARRHFISWDRPLLPQAVAFLAGGWEGDGPLDLSALLVIVPTQQSGRRLREALAGHAAARGQAAFPPRIFEPKLLVAQGLGPDVASRLESLLAWVEVFRSLELEAFRDVFPVDPPARNFSWALCLAQEFARLQALLAEAGLRLADVDEKAGENFCETARWRQLGELERLHAEKLAALGLRDAQAAKITAAKNPPPLANVGKIILLATPDPLPLALDVLAVHARTLPLEIVIFAPPAEADAFDGWGRPLPPAWEHRALALPEFEQRVHLCADPAAQAERIVAVARSYGAPEGRLGVGVPDSEVTPLLENALARAGLAAYNPAGRARRGEGLYHLLAALAALAREPSFDAVEALARCPDFLKFLQARHGHDFSAARWLEGLDELRSRHLPANLATAQAQAVKLKKCPGLGSALAVIDELYAVLANHEFSDGVSTALRMIFGGRQLDPVRENDARFEDSATAWMELLRECAAAGARFAGLAKIEWWDLALPLFGESMCTEDKPAGALEVQGVLELLFEDAPHLAVAGFNDGFVPESVAGDPFLPESIREELGLKTNAARFARDAYVLQALAACRAHSGRIDLLFGKTSTAGDPLRPSRLLLRCADAELPARIAFLFRAPEHAQANPSWTRAWPLTPRRVSVATQVAVTALRRWLECPFRFYLRHGLGLTVVDPSKNELDAGDFGALCHAALEAMGREAALRDCTDAGVLRDFLLAGLDRRVRADYGEILSLPLIIQLESARQRLARAAEVQAGERAAGWVITEVEKKFSIELAGLRVNGKIDRIDRHVETGAVRVLDYKTSDSPASPHDAHVRVPAQDPPPPAWAIFDQDGRPRAWIDLQLPLYLHALAAEFPGAVTCGYFNLPKAASGTGLALWDDYTPELHAAALRCAEGVCAAIRAGKFWPPNEQVRADYDEFAALFHHGVAASVAWEEAKP